jgi:glyoxylase-like metal-dependent hydrolase (beta-lactamase superfamily II)
MTKQLNRRNMGAALLSAPLALVASPVFGANKATSPTIHRFEQKVPFPVNAYIVEGSDGVVVVDSTLTVTSALALRKTVDALGKPMRAVLLTHPHPDHYVGLAGLTAGLDVPIVAIAGVDDVVRRDDAEKDRVVGAMFGKEWPQKRVFPNQRISEGTRLDYGPGLAFQAVDIGPAESLHDSMFLLEGDKPIAFAGDLAYSLMHSYMADGQNDKWHKAIERVTSEFPETTLLMVGHGAPTTPGLLAWQRTYLDLFEAAVRAADWHDSKAASAAVVAAMKNYLPSDQLVFLMQLSIEPTARRLGVLK